MSEELTTMLFAALMWGGVGITLLGCRPRPLRRPRSRLRPAPIHALRVVWRQPDGTLIPLVAELL